MLVQTRQLGSWLGQEAKTVSWIGVSICKNCKRYSPPSAETTNPSEVPVEVFIPSINRSFTVKTDGNGWAKLELPVPVGTPVQVKAIVGGEKWEEPGKTGSEPGSGMVNFYINPVTNPSAAPKWVPWAIGAGAIVLGGFLWWMFTREEEAESALDPALGDIRKLSKKELAGKILKYAQFVVGDIKAKHTEAAEEWLEQISELALELRTRMM